MDQERENLLQMHCEARSQQMYAALDALAFLDAKQLAAVLSAHRAGDDKAIRFDMNAYRVALANTMGIKGERAA